MGMGHSSETTTLVGVSAAAAALRDDIAFAAQADAKVLITGETGVGKDLVARLIHANSRRRPYPMATLNCAGLPETLLESELFGHMRGSFTDAHRDKAGIFESAANGTVFLDEVGEMSPRMQAILLRFLETGELQRIGADRVHARVNVRVLAATNRDLMAEIRAGRFREDLYYRLNVLRIHVVPLRERREDVPALLDRYVTEFSRRHDVSPKELSPEVVARLSSHNWPGNVRQLKNVVERMVVKSRQTVIDMTDLPRDLETPGATAAASGSGHGPTLALVDRSVVPSLLTRMLEGRESFWSVVHVPFMNRDLTRAQLTEIVSRGLERSGGNYRNLVALFNMAPTDYKRFLTFLSSHRCHVRFQPFRVPTPVQRAPFTAEAAQREAQAVGF